MTGKRTIVAATSNKHKLTEIAATLAPFDYRVVSRTDLGIPDFEIEESGVTFEENSFLKAREIFDWLGGQTDTLADDSGIEVDALGGGPGVFSARFAGQDRNAVDFMTADMNTEQMHRSRQDRANNAKLLRLLEGTPAEKRTARFVSVITYLRPGMEPVVCRGEVEGRIDFKETGTAGFGYDPLFIPVGYEYSFGLFTPEGKNSISHRGLALAALAKRLRDEKG